MLERSQSCVVVKEVKEEDVTSLCRKNTRVGVRLVATETSGYGQEGIRATSTRVLLH